MSEPLKVLEPTVFKSAMESADAPAIDPVLQFRVVSYVAMAVAAPFVIGHLLIGIFGFPYLAQLFAQEALPAPTALMLGMGWLARPIIALIDIATFWLIYRLAKRWWIGLLFVPAFIYLMMMGFIGFLSYLPLFPLVPRTLSAGSDGPTRHPVFSSMRLAASGTRAYAAGSPK